MAVCREIAMHLERAVAAADLIIENETARAADTSLPTQIQNEATQRTTETGLIRNAILDVYDVV